MRRRRRLGPRWSPLADRINHAAKFVATETLGELGWNNSVRITGDVAEGVSRLKEQDGPLLQVHGSWQLIQTLLAHGLIDEFRLWTFPVVVGSGKRLFGSGSVPTDLTLTKTKAGPSGAVMTIYRKTNRA